MARKPKQTDADRAEIALLVRKWRDSAALPASRAAQVLGISKRTYEGIEQGRGFAYPLLLILALKAFE